MKKSLYITVIILLIMPLTVVAMTLKTGPEYSLGESEVIDGDIYVFAGNSTVLGDVNGDLVTAGGNVLVSGKVSQDLTAAGGTVEILGAVGDDVRAAGGRILIKEDVGGDILVAGGSVNILEGVNVVGDVRAAGGQVIIGGDVEGDVVVAGGEVSFRGKVSGDVSVVGADKVILGENADIAGNFYYKSKQEAEINENAKIAGEVTFDKITRNINKRKSSFLPAVFAFSFFSKIVFFLVVALVAVLVFRNFSRSVVDRSVANLGKDFLKGLVVVIITPIVGMLLLITILGIPIAFVLGLLYLLAICLAKIYTGIVFGGLISKWTKKEVSVNWKWAVVGVLAIQIVILIPIIGWIAACVMFIISFGSISHLAYQHLWLKR